MSLTARSERAASRVGVVGILLVLVAGACGGGEDPLEIGVKRSALDLLFEEESEGGEEGPAAAPGPQETLGPEPGNVGGPAPEPTASARPVPTTAPVETCPEAGPDAFPEDPAATTISRPPAEGVYGYHNQGTFEIEGAVPLKGPYPPSTTREVELLDHPPEERMRFQVTHRGFGDAVVEKTYRVTGADGGESALELVRLHEESQQGELTFEPTPPVTIVGLGQGEGASWNSAGMDPETGTAMVVQGEIERRELVDACGDVFDTYRVVSEETIVNVSTGFRRETEEPTVYNVATHLGGLFLREEVHNTTTWQGERGPTTLNLDYVGTADSVEPAPAS